MPTTNAFRCVLMGDQSLLPRCGEVLIERGHGVVAVVTGSRAVADWADAQSIPALAAPKAGQNFGAVEAALAETAYDWYFSIANLRIVPPGLRARARQGAINFHDGPLPLYAGLNAPAWAILAGETRFGVTWHAMTDSVDAGSIHVQRLFDLTPDETAFTLNSRCFEAGLESFRDLVAAIEADQLEARPQTAGASVFDRHRRPEAAGLLRFDRPAEDLERLVRALDFGPGYANPLVMPKLRLGDATYRVGSLSATETLSVSPPGTVLAVAAESITVASLDRAVRIEGLFDHEGAAIAPTSLLEAGQRLPLLDEAEAEDLSRLVAAVVRHEDAIRRRLASGNPFVLTEARDGAGATQAHASLPLSPPPLGGDRLVAALAGYLVRVSPDTVFDIAYADAAVEAAAQAYPGLFAPALPLRIAVDEAATTGDLERSVAAEIGLLRHWGTHLSDLPARFPELSGRRPTVGLVQAEEPTAAHALPGCAVTFVVGTRRPELLLVHDLARFSAPEAEALAGRVGIALHAFAQSPHFPLRDLPLMSITERERMLSAWTGPAGVFDRTACVHTLIEAQVDLNPEATALVFGDESVTYRELDARANRVAGLLRERNVGPDRPVGLCIRRGIDLVVGALAIQKAGSAYLPLDPAYPSERLAFMIEDSGVTVVLTQRTLAGSVPGRNRALVAMEEAAGQSTGRVASGAGPEDAAYVIYTSGSTGRPKGVVIEHRNVANFFAGMDERVSWRTCRDPVWLAVTSLNFDIAVLELFWTLARGFKVVIAAPRASAAEAGSNQGGMAFSLFHWGNDDAAGRDKYRLLIEGAKFADAHGFRAVWTPERHFHAFGGPYPNPAVTGAAVAAVTRNVEIRAGSCVLPLHHPARVAEEWAVVDNLSDGRVGIAFASGWMPEDFVLRPENEPPHNKHAMLRDIEIVRRLWRGESVPFETAGGKTVAVATLPRPVQAELPVWVTTAGNPDTFREAAHHGANVLTHLLGQTIEELAEKIAAYRASLAEAGRDPSAHTVTLMLHTLLGADREEVRALARAPMRDYLRSAAGLIKQYAWAFPAFKRPVGVNQPMALDLSALEPEEMEAILDFAFERYFEDSGLFGTVDDALARAAALRAVGVDEIACLIDFGIPNEIALERLHPLAAVVARASVAPEAGDVSLGGEIRRHGVTHLQCTPSMMRMLLADGKDRAALGAVNHLYLGGEALPSTLLAEMEAAGIGQVENMYGPTETTIWSSTQPALPCDGVVPLGRPIVNTRFYVLDAQGRLVPPGLSGELYIGGAGVARGYLGRPELDVARFLADPFLPGERLYRTGDRVRSDADGTLHYLGRVDDQVKLRGHRIELGEIEAALRTVPGISEAVATVREDQPGDARLVAYLRLSDGPVPTEVLRAHLGRSLPEVMIPALFIPLDRFPLTANAKVDRNALPAPASVAPPADAAPPADDLEQRIAAVFGRVLGLERIGRSDNFFGLGGHSLLAVQAHRDLKAAVAPDLVVTDLFRFPTVAGLARHLSDRGATDAVLGQVADRAAHRRSAMRLRAGPAPLARDVG